MIRYVKSLLLVLCVGLMFLSSCKKEELEDTNLANPEESVSGIGKMSCFIEGSKWDAKTYYATVFNNVLTFYGVGKNNDTIVISVLLNQDKYYEFYSSGINNGVYKNRGVDTIGYQSTYNVGSGSQNVGSPAGKINFSDLDIHNGLISGTFTFRVGKVGGNELPITEGKFVNLGITPLTVVTNTMRAKVNGSIDAVCSPVTALRNLIDKQIFISGVFGVNKSISVRFNTDTISAGDTLNMNQSTFGIYFDGAQSIISHNGKVIINSYDTIAKVINLNFDYSYNGTTIEDGVANVEYVEN